MILQDIGTVVSHAHTDRKVLGKILLFFKSNSLVVSRVITTGFEKFFANSNVTGIAN
jgi:hypothetical protein